MKIQYKNWRIEAHKPYGFVARKKVGTQWKHPAYYSKLDQAVCHVFDRVMSEDLEDVSIDTTPPNNAKKALENIAMQLTRIKNELVEACNGQ